MKHGEQADPSPQPWSAPRPKPARGGGAYLRTITCLLLIAFPLAPLQAETLLHLGETATVMASPDELHASLQARAAGGSPADVQARVNAMMANALARARQVAGLTISTGRYVVYRTGPTAQDRIERWQGSQTLDLTSREGDGLLKLTGELQQQGLTVSQLGWRLSREVTEKAHAQAIKQALSGLRNRVEEAAGLLGLRFDSFKRVQIDTPPVLPTPRMMAMSAAASAPTPPNAVAEDVAVTATAEADAVLLPP